jgi:hypothetical protein
VTAPVIPTSVVTSTTAVPPTKKTFGWFPRKDKDAIVTAPVAAAATPPATGPKGTKDRIFSFLTQTSQSTAQPTAPPSAKEIEELEEEEEDQENVRPFASTTTVTPSLSVTQTPSNILKENKSIPTTFTPTPMTPMQPQQSSSTKSNSYEPSPPPPNTNTTATPSQTHSSTHNSKNSSPPQPQYQIDDRDDSDASDTDGEDEQQSIPDWAKQPKLRQALERQYGLVAGVPAVDPDTIFPDVQSCVLEEIFGRKIGKSGRYDSYHAPFSSLVLTSLPPPYLL